MALQISLSAYQAWQRCEQRYDYQYRQKLRPLVRDVAPERGIILHEYLEAYYGGLQKGDKPEQAHAAGEKRIMGWADKVKVYTATAFYAGDEKTAEAYNVLIPQIIDIAERYFAVRGRQDAERLIILQVEQWLRVVLAAGINSASKVDMITRDRETGRTSLWEHKSTGSVPESTVRLTDFQTLLYTAVLRRLGTEIDSIQWNYLRTKDPDIPHQNQKKTDGVQRFSTAVAIDTTWEIYARAVRNAGQDPDDPHYAAVKQRLDGAEESIWFPRYEHVVVADPSILLRDYVRTAVRIRFATAEWEAGANAPVRTIARDCQFCQFQRICEAAILGGDPEDVIRLRFSRAEEREKANG